MTIPQITPNIHPILVHFPIALLMTASALYIMSFILGRFEWANGLKRYARLNLLIGAAMLLVTLLSGYSAFNSVSHAGGGHQAMLEHRSWAIPAAIVWSILALWALVRPIHGTVVKTAFTLFLVVGCTFLTITGHTGARLVFEHAIGVRLPDVEAPDNLQGDNESSTPHKHGGHAK